MPPKKTTEAGASTGNNDCTDSEIKLMIAIMELMTRPSLDYDALALKLGSASANAARMRVSAAVNKHPTWFTGAGAATNEDGTPVKKTRAKRTPKKKAPSDDDENAEEQDTPSKKKARTGKAKPKTKVEEDVPEEGIKREGVKQEGVKQEGVKQGGVKQEGVKQEGVKQGGVKQEGVKQEISDDMEGQI